MIFYHGTAALHLAAIKAKGLVPRAAPGGDAWAAQDPDFVDSFGHPRNMETPARCRSVFLTRKLIVASWFADMAAKVNKSAPLVLSVDLPTFDISKLVVDEEGDTSDPDFSVRFEGVIPPDIISVLPASKLALVPHLGV